MSEPILNVPMMRKVADWVSEQLALPADQSELYLPAWYKEVTEPVCKTTMCVAGKTLDMEGFTFRRLRREYATDLHQEWIAISPEGEEVDIFETAADILGLSFDEAEHLFLETVEETVLGTMEDIVESHGDRL